jgi:hypothetical protein
MNNTLDLNIDQPQRKKIAVALFRSACLATEAIQELHKASFSDTDILIAIRDPQSLREFTHQTNTQPFHGFPNQNHETRVRSLLDWLTGIALLVIRCGLSEQEARWVEADYRSGAILVIVEDEGRWTEALAILQLNGGDVDFNRSSRSISPQSSVSNLVG